MSASKPTSPARIAANRRNAQLSTGPKTPEAGKARARANAVKHGLTGAGVALPTEDTRRDRHAIPASCRRSSARQTVAGAELVHELAMLTVRRHRAERAEAAHLHGRVRRAGVEFDRARCHRAGQMIEAIEAHPRAYRELLLDMPEGVDRLIDRSGRPPRRPDTVLHQSGPSSIIAGSMPCLASGPTTSRETGRRGFRGRSSATTGATGPSDEVPDERGRANRVGD